VVAAIGKLLGHALDPLFGEWSAQNYAEELAPLKECLIEATGLFKRATDSLRERERDLIDYYAVDLVNMACSLVNSWLLRAMVRSCSVNRNWRGCTLRPNCRRFIALARPF